MTSTAAATVAASADEKKAVAYEAFEASEESRYRLEGGGHSAQRDEAAGAGGQQHPYAARQSALLTLTLEEIQNTICETSKTFGSMNMDELLSNIWPAEDATPMATGGTKDAGDATAADGGGVAVDNNGNSGGGGGEADAATDPPSLYRQGSVSLPAKLCQKTVDEVWSEMQRDQQQQYPPPPPTPQGHMQSQQYESSRTIPGQTSSKKLTLEDFLIKAGVVRDDVCPGNSSPQRLNQFPVSTSSPPMQQQQQGQYGLTETYGVLNERPGYGPIQMTTGYGDLQDAGTATNGIYHNYHLQHQQQEQQQQGVLRNGYCGGGVGYGGGDSGMDVGIGSPMSPVSSDGFCGHSQVDNGNGNPGGPWAMDMGAGSTLSSGAGGGARKRILDGPVDKVMERRQRRMIKNRESAARSRARKQAYTVQLETELNLLKEENARLLEEQRRLTARRRQMLLDAVAERVHANSQKNVRALRHCSSCHW